MNKVIRQRKARETVERESAASLTPTSEASEDTIEVKTVTVEAPKKPRTRAHNAPIPNTKKTTTKKKPAKKKKKPS